jgi:hypothetical protein
MEVNIHLVILSNLVKTMAYLNNILCLIHLNKMGCQNKRIALWLKLPGTCLQHLNWAKAMLQLATFKTITTHL